MFDFGIGATELLLIAMVALIVVGPKDLPRLLKTIGQFTRKIQGMAREFQHHLNEAAKEAGIEDVKKEVRSMTDFSTAELDKEAADIRKAMETSAPKPTASAPARPELAKLEEPRPVPATPTETAGKVDPPAKDTVEAVAERPRQAAK